MPIDSVRRQTTAPGRTSENWAPRLKHIGVEIASTIPVPLQTSDFLPYLAKMDRSSTALLAVFFASDIIGLLKQRRDLGITVPVMSVTGVTAAVAPDVLKDAAGTFVPESLPRELRFMDAPAIRETRKAISHFWETWENVYRSRPGSGCWTCAASEEPR